MPIHAMVSRTVNVVCPCGCGHRFPVKVQVPIRGSLELVDADRGDDPEALTGGLRENERCISEEGLMRKVIVPVERAFPPSRAAPSRSGSEKGPAGARMGSIGPCGRSSSAPGRAAPWQERARRKLRREY